MPILLWPFPTGGPAPPPPTPFPRHPTGKVFIIDAVPSIAEHAIYFFGPNPNLGESCAMVFNVGPGLPTAQAPVLFTFVKPDGTIYLGDPNFAFIGSTDIGQRLIPNFPAGQYLVYTFGVGELGQRGLWQVSAITTGFFSNTYSFSVV